MGYCIKDEVKAVMLKEGTSEMTVGRFIVRWTEILSSRFDSTAFKKVMPDVYKAYTKSVTSRLSSSCISTILASISFDDMVCTPFNSVFRVGSLAVLVRFTVSA